MLNFAHGDVIMVGGYVSFILTMYVGMNGWLALLVAMVACTILGILIERLAYRPFHIGPQQLHMAFHTQMIHPRQDNASCASP